MQEDHKRLRRSAGGRRKSWPVDRHFGAGSFLHQVSAAPFKAASSFILWPAEGLWFAIRVARRARVRAKTL